jgi:hypothetical protein
MLSVHIESHFEKSTKICVDMFIVPGPMGMACYVATALEIRQASKHGVESTTTRLVRQWAQMHEEPFSGYM